MPAYIRQVGVAEQGLEALVHDVMGIQGNALRGGKYEAVILQGCAALEANAVHAAPMTKCVGSETVRATDD
jgi:hypothetical protein